jgi:hypothetical protein
VVILENHDLLVRFFAGMGIAVLVMLVIGRIFLR